MARHVVWEWVAEPGLEYLSLHQGADVSIDSVVVFQKGSQISRLHYSVSCTQTWSVRILNIALHHAGALRTLNLQQSDAGVWTLDGHVQENLAGCTDIDLEASPFTNTLPIRRLALAPDEAKVVKVAYVAFPDLTVTAADQEYTRIGGADPAVKFRYRSLSSGFTTELAVDAEGLVEDYPEFWRRLL